MINVLFIWAVLLILFVCGIFFCKLMKLDHAFYMGHGVYLVPLIGLIGIINIVELFNLFMTVRLISILVFIIIICSGIVLRNEIISAVKCLCQNKFLVFLVLVTSVIFSYPVIIQNELSSFQVDNNDIMYYLSSMEWLADHSSTGQVNYSDTAPFYWCAEYMLERTRIGFDGFGSFIMCLFHLQAYQVFSDLGILFVIMSIFSVYYLLHNVLALKGKRRDLFTIIILLGTGWGELLIYQYVPQILGIVCLITFIGVAVQFLINDENDKGILVAWILSGTIAVYAEFAVHLFVIYLCLCGIQIWKRKSIKWIKKPVIYGFIGLLLNPVGVYKGIKLNLFVLTNAQGSMENIDPYAGNIMQYYNVFGRMFGLFHSGGKESILSMLMMIVLIECIGLVIVLFALYIAFVRDQYKSAIMGIAAFFVAYEIYFRVIRYAYGEYKHLISITAFMILLLADILDQVCLLYKGKKTIMVIEWCILVTICICGCKHIKDTIGRGDLYIYNHELEELAAASCYLPDEEVIGISGTPATIHGEVYALRNRKCTILANNISYFPFSLAASTRYRVYEGNHIPEENENVVWSDNRYSIVENIGLQSCFYSGFHVPDHLDTEDRWTCDKESIIVINNYSDTEKELSLYFGTDAKKTKTIKVMYNGKVIAEAESGQQIVTEPVLLGKSQEVKVYIYTEDDLDLLDGKMVGIKIQDYMLLDYSG